MHCVILVVAPLIIGRLLSRVLADNNQFTNEEQEQIKKDIAEIKAMLASRLDTNRSRAQPET
jgi:hypothetical protein